MFYIIFKKAIDFVELSLFAFCKYNGGLLMNKMEGWWSLQWWMEFEERGYAVGVCISLEK